MQIEEIIEKYQKLVFSVCLNLLKDYYEAENITQDTFVIYLAKYNNHTENQNAKSLLCKIATNKCLDYLKSSYVRKTECMDPNGIKDIGIYETTPETKFIENEFKEKIKENIKQLKSPYSEIATMYYIDELTVEEISNKTKTFPKTVQTKIYRARNKLREMRKEDTNALI